jgi:hypothetical protein
VRRFAPGLRTAAGRWSAKPAVLTRLVPLMRRKLLLPLVIPLVLSGCRPETVELVYQFDSDHELTYRLHAHGDSRWDLGEPGSGSYEAAFLVTERVVSVEEDGAVVDVIMDPEHVEGEGLLPPEAETHSFRLRLGKRGERLEVLEIDGAPATGFSQDETAVINTYRPLLPLEPVSLQQTWPAEQQVQLESSFEQLNLQGRLDGLGLDNGREVAELTFEGEGPLTRTAEIEQGTAEFTGSSTVEGAAVLDIDQGFLRTARSTTVSDFEVRVTPEEGAVPLRGTLHTKLDLELELVD